MSRWTGLYRGAGACLLLLGAGCAAARSSPPAAPAADDQTLRTRIEASLLNAPGVHAGEVRAEVVDGVATLSGTVHDQGESEAALAAARRVEGVRDVRNSLRIP